jgi:hypothetical protein
MWHVKGDERCKKIYISLGIPEGYRKLGRPRCRWEGNIKM